MVADWSCAAVQPGGILAMLREAGVYVRITLGNRYNVKHGPNGMERAMECK